MKGNLTTPQWWATATNLTIPAVDTENFRWVK
jgi:hypothetical protein